VLTRREVDEILGPPRPLLTQLQVAEILGYTTRTVRTLAARGELRRVVLGGRSTRYRAEDVEDLIERRTQPHNDDRTAANGPVEKERDDGAQLTD